MLRQETVSGIGVELLPLMCLHSQPQTEPSPVPPFQLPPCPQEPPG